MKRITLAVALVLLLALAAVGPAMASPPTPPVYPDGTYVFVDGGWFVMQGGVMGVFNGWMDLDGDEVYETPPPPIPNNSDIYITIGWIAYSRGLCETAPLALRNRVTVNGEWVVNDRATDRASWWPVYQMDFSADYPPFNPKLGAKGYEIDWLYHYGVTDTGTYDCVFYQSSTRKMNDLTGGWFDGQHAPVLIPPTDWVFPFTFVVL